MSVSLNCIRYGAPEVIEYDTVEQAINGALYMIDFNTASPGEITDESGTLLMDADEVRERAWELAQVSTPSI